MQLKILVAGALGGRFDHEAGNLNVLYKFPDLRIILLSDDCLIQLLPKNFHHEIHVQSAIEGPHCGLIPLGTASARTTTSGLQWDLSKHLSCSQNVKTDCLYLYLFRLNNTDSFFLKCSWFCLWLNWVCS